MKFKDEIFVAKDNVKYRDTYLLVTKANMDKCNAIDRKHVDIKIKKLY